MVRVGAKREECRWCGDAGEFSFGWVDKNGDWKDPHYACAKHAEVSVLQQNYATQFAQMRDQHRRLFQNPDGVVLLPINN